MLGWEDRRLDLEGGRRWLWAARGERATVAVKEIRRIRWIGMLVRDKWCCGVRHKDLGIRRVHKPMHAATCRSKLKR